MKIKISYFYQIRNFKKYQIPVSTAASDPKWYHDYKRPSYVYKDKNGVYNGIRMKYLHPNFEAKCCKGCLDNPDECSFIQEYQEQLNNTDFNLVFNWLAQLANNIKDKEHFTEEPEIILIVYETPDNKCSKRKPIIDWFYNNGIEITEYNKNEEAIWEKNH